MYRRTFFLLPLLPYLSKWIPEKPKTITPKVNVRHWLGRDGIQELARRVNEQINKNVKRSGGWQHEKAKSSS